MKFNKYLPLFLSALLSSALFSSGCVVTPTNLESRVYDDAEVRLVSTIKRGKDYAVGGRLEQAELEFRRALLLAPQRASIYNDLGYVLLAQGRHPEARGAFEDALELSPGDFAARENLATVLYKQDLFRESLWQYQELLRLNDLEQISKIDRPEKRELSGAELASVYRSMSLIYYTVGNIEEALCYSKLAMRQDTGDGRLEYYVRLLLAEERIEQALTIVSQEVLRARDRVVPQLMLDYGIALQQVERGKLANQAFLKVVSAPSARAVDRRSAKLMLALLASREERVREADRILGDLIDEMPALCENYQPVQWSYWPFDLLDQTSQLLKQYCNAGEEDEEQVQPIV